MDELIAKMDAEIAVIQTELDAVDATLATKRQNLNRLKQAKEALAGTRKATGYNYVAKKPSGPHGTTRGKIAALLEERGSMRSGEIAKAIGVSPSTPYQSMKGHPWFAMNGHKGDMSTTWSLTEAGRNRHASAS